MEAYYPRRDYQAEKAAAIRNEAIARADAQAAAEQLMQAQMNPRTNPARLGALEQTHIEATRRLEAAINATGQD